MKAFRVAAIASRMAFVFAALACRTGPSNGTDVSSPVEPTGGCDPAVCDADADGSIAVAYGGTDCDDADPAVHVRGHEICNGIDDDCDELTDDADPGLDLLTATHWWADLDGDGAGGGSAVARCVAPPESVPNGGDCDDGAAGVHPGATEVCNEVDDDCDDLVDDEDASLDASTTTTFYEDGDGDGYGDAAAPVRACAAPDGAVADDTDCAPLDPAHHAPTPWWPDGDGDGAGDPDADSPVLACLPPPATAGEPDDCDDNDPEEHPGAVWYRDIDLDGFGDPAFWVAQCLRPEGYSADGNDCDDTDPRFAPDILFYVDADGDGFGDPDLPFPSCPKANTLVDDATDCDDLRAADFPGADETCDERDNNCDGTVDNGLLVDWYVDLDLDGWGGSTDTVTACEEPEGHVSVDGDCDDLDPGTYPGAPEACGDPDFDCDTAGRDVGFVGPLPVQGSILSQDGRAADLDGDGDTDVAWVSTGADEVGWTQNLGAGLFGAEDLLDAVTNGPGELAVADLDQDGDPDVIVSFVFADRVSWYQNHGGGNFATVSQIASTIDNATSPVVTDLDGDGDPDVLAGSLKSDEIVWVENLGAAALFAAPAVVTDITDGPTVVRAADLDGDGDPDVLCASTSDDTVGWFENLGGGSFGPGEVIGDAVDVNAMEVDDLDADGDIDIVTAADGDGSIAVYENLGAGLFADATPVDWLTAGFLSLAVVDVDGDALADLVAGSLFDATLLWYQNLGGGAFGPRLGIVDLTSVFWVTSGDIDANGTTDLVAGLPDADSVDWFSGEVCE